MSGKDTKRERLSLLWNKIAKPNTGLHSDKVQDRE